MNNYQLSYDLSVKRRDLIRYLKNNGFICCYKMEIIQIYTNGLKTIPVKRHRQFDRFTANELCKQAGLKTKF